ncbi:MAG TPA: twin-arginine translocation signal domain-containing protein, partial [Bryobacteraceae bacterium]
MTPNISRRGFLKTAGALIVSFSAERVGQAQFGIAPIAGSPSGGDLDSWIAIGADGMVTAYSGKEELGQGISTAQL